MRFWYIIVTIAETIANGGLFITIAVQGSARVIETTAWILALEIMVCLLVILWGVWLLKKETK